MNVEEIKAIIAAKIAGQGSMVDIGGGLPAILNALCDAIGNLDFPNLTSKTYAQLKAMRDAGTLEPGMFYRITDYVTTTVQENTQSAGHAFDLIVLAISQSRLSEDAAAIRHPGDFYFNGVNLNAWKIKYSLDNDTDRFAWADETNGKGVIYKMIDENNNECPYDFKNIMFARESSTVEDLLGFTPEDESIYLYTFTWVNEDNEIEDLSIVGPNLLNDEGMYSGIFGNIIKECSEYGMTGESGNTFRFVLSNNIFISTYAFEDGIFYGCNYNTLGNDCYSNTFGNGCNYNTLGNDCYSNTFGNGCNSNTFDGNCAFNTFVDSCSYNIFGNNCRTNSFGSACISNIFGNGCGSNRFDGNCDFNTFGNSCSSNTFGSDCRNNTFGNDCYSNTFGNGCDFNTFGNGCSSNIFGASNNAVIDFVRNINFGDGCNYLCLISSDTIASGGNQLQNVSVAQGLAGTNGNPITITIPDRNLAYETKVGKDSDGTLKIYCEENGPLFINGTISGSLILVDSIDVIVDAIASGRNVIVVVNDGSDVYCPVLCANRFAGGVYVCLRGTLVNVMD